MKPGVSDDENSIFPEADAPVMSIGRHRLLRTVVIACFVLLALVSAGSLVQIYRMAGLLTAPILGYLVAVPGMLFILGLAAALLLAFGRPVGWHLAAATAICVLWQQLVSLLIQLWDGTGVLPDLRWPFWLAGTLLAISLLGGRQFRGAFGITAAAFRNALLAWNAVGAALALLLQSV